MRYYINEPSLFSIPSINLSMFDKHQAPGMICKMLSKKYPDWEFEEMAPDIISAVERNKKDDGCMFIKIRERW